MKMFKKIEILSIMLLMANHILASDPDAPPITANKFSTPPVIDGEMESMWEPLPWHSLNYVWVPWGSTVDPADYSGRFRIGWSEETDLLYFFIEITDDVLVERFAEMGNTAHYNDIIEVFIDEDNSGGLHVFDGTGGTGDSWGTNAENAFSYHITPLAVPSVGSPVTDFYVHDIDGTGWGDNQSVDYISHFPEAVLSTDGEKYYWEFSLIVYNDEYEFDNPDTDVALELGKEMGLALAYCETDNPSVYLREMFMGSFEGDPDELGDVDSDNKQGYNETWKDATDYNVLTLAEELVINNDQLKLTADGMECMADRQSGIIRLHVQNEYMGELELEVFDLLGKRIMTERNEKRAGSFRWNVQLDAMNHGVYIVRVTAGEQQFVRKVLY